MFFGLVDLELSSGCISAHTVQLGDHRLRKGQTIVEADIQLLRANDIKRVWVARLTDQDIHENEAAYRLAEKTAGIDIRIGKADTGRVNLFAERSGILVLDKAGIDGLNLVDEGITLGTLNEYSRVRSGELLASVKIIPYGVGQDVLGRALDLLTKPLLSVAATLPMRITVVSTTLPGLKTATVEKGLTTLARRLDGTGCEIIADVRVEHDTQALARVLNDIGDGDLLIVYGAAATSDRSDIIPAAITAAGGVVHHFGMPVDPGNLLVLGEVGGKWVVGSPGCARSPRESGFDWVLFRLLAGLEVTSLDIRRMGVGGLLKEIKNRPSPRTSDGKD